MVRWTKMVHYGSWTTKKKIHRWTMDHFIAGCVADKATLLEKENTPHILK